MPPADAPGGLLMLIVGGAVGTYDAWYGTARGRALLATETEALRPLIEAFPGPRIEVGVGTGRFAEALGARFGLDPSCDALQLARRRGISVAAGVGEAVPFVGGHFGAVLMAFTLCFLVDPAAALLEARRLLADDGGLVVGFIPAGTPWADLYALRGRQGHPIYRHASFYTVDEVEQLLTRSGLRVTARRSTLRQRPGLERYAVEVPSDDIADGAGFAAISAVRQRLLGNA